jgi:hypothetical protein
VRGVLQVGDRSVEAPLAVVPFIDQTPWGLHFLCQRFLSAHWGAWI